MFFISKKAFEQAVWEKAKERSEKEAQWHINDEIYKRLNRIEKILEID